MDMKAVRERLIEHEGLKLEMYKCTSDYWTIGVGRNIETRGISIETAMQMLDEDIEIVHTELQSTLEGFSDMPIPVQEALVDLAFNMGTPTLRSFKRCLQALKEREWAIASDELLDSRYAKQVGQRAITIANMIRNCES